MANTSAKRLENIKYILKQNSAKNIIIEKIPFLSIINCRNEDKTSWSHKLDTLNPKRLKYITQSINITSPLRITFEPFVDLPMGLQDNAGGIINNTIISVGGFCGGGFLWKEPYCCGKRGF